MNAGRWLQVVALLFAAAAGYHLLAILAPSLGIRGALWRHAAFALIDSSCAVLVIRRPVWFPVGFAGLTLQQLYSHGGEVWAAWSGAHRVDWLSIGVILVMPITLGVLLHDRRLAWRSGRPRC